MRALLETIGLSREISGLFVEAIFLWRSAVQSASVEMDNIAPLLLERKASLGTLSPAASELMEMVAKLAIAEERRRARDHALELALAA